MYKCVRSLRELGDGRRRTTVLVGDSEDGRTSDFGFAGCVHQNWPCKRQVTLKNGDRTQTLFGVSTQTVACNFAFSFFWNGHLAFIFFGKNLREVLWPPQFE